MAGRIPSAENLFREVLQNNPDVDVNTLHNRTFQRMIHYRAKYYESRVDSILSELELPLEIQEKIKKLLETIIVEGKEYSNFMEEVPLLLF